MKNKQSYRMSRRTFLRHLESRVAAGYSRRVVLRGGERIGQRLAFGPQATPPIVLPSPAPSAGAATPTPTPELTNFLTLSTLLTGVSTLSPELGRVYLQSLQTSKDEATVTMAELFSQAGLQSEEPPTTLAALEATGIFAQEQTRSLTDRITDMWYSGIFKNEAGEEEVATYVDALAWQTLRFTKPKTICGEPGFWAQAWIPQVE
ncbi:MAG: sugar dehydrogenase complex small subunit [Caldilineaceae bacterium]